MVSSCLTQPRALPVDFLSLLLGSGEACTLSLLQQGPTDCLLHPTHSLGSILNRASLSPSPGGEMDTSGLLSATIGWIGFLKYS
uniref:Uncharacterized protein n=1 Tax=Mus musculus TaxID=10090 RepID=Q3V2L4_MOUSE|nr:unnamed protein product [Mus musculus]